MCSGWAMEVSWGFFELDRSWAMWWGSWLKISRRTPTRQSRQASSWKMEWKGTRGLRWGFPQKFPVGPKLGEVEGCAVGNLNGPQLGYLLRFFVGDSEMDPDSAI